MPVVIAPTQFVHQFPQPGRQLGFGAEAPLQPFADRIADRPAGPTINLFDIVVGLGVHGNSLRSFARRVPHRNPRWV